MTRTIEEILHQSRTIAVVGLSSDPLRPSFGVASYMQSAGYRIIPVNPKETEVLGEVAYPSLAAIPTDVAVDIVNVFRRPEQTPEVAREAIARGTRVLWLQLGIRNPETAALAAAAGIDYVEDECILIRHRTLPHD